MPEGTGSIPVRSVIDRSPACFAGHDDFRSVSPLIPATPAEPGNAGKCAMPHSWKRTLMLSRRWIRPIASAKSGATEITVTFAESSTG